jgi:hypothetical protein
MGWSGPRPWVSTVPFLDRCPAPRRRANAVAYVAGHRVVPLSLTSIATSADVRAPHLVFPIPICRDTAAHLNAGARAYAVRARPKVMPFGRLFSMAHLVQPFTTELFPSVRCRARRRGQAVDARPRASAQHCRCVDAARTRGNQFSSSRPCALTRTHARTHPRKQVAPLAQIP